MKIPCEVHVRRSAEGQERKELHQLPIADDSWCCRDFFSAWEDRYIYLANGGVYLAARGEIYEEITFCPFCGQRVELQMGPERHFQELVSNRSVEVREWVEVPKP